MKECLVENGKYPMRDIDVWKLRIKCNCDECINIKELYEENDLLSIIKKQIEDDENENKCSKCNQEGETLYKSKKDGKKYCIFCIGVIRKEREKEKYPVNNYEKGKRYSKKRHYKKILL